VVPHTSCRKEEEYVSAPTCIQPAGKYFSDSGRPDQWEDHHKCLSTETMAAPNPKEIFSVKHVYYLTTFLLASILQKIKMIPPLPSSASCFFSDIYHQASSVLCP